MRQLLDFWRAEIARSPVVLLALGALAVTLVMNARTGYRLGDDSLEIAGVLVAIGLAAAYAGAVLWHERGARRVGLAVVLIVGIVVDQMSAWQTLGIKFADGGVARQTKATGLETASERLAARRAEVKKLGAQRAIEAIRADQVLECEKKSKVYPDGIGPKCTALRVEMATAERVSKLDGEIAVLLTQLEGREQVAGGAPQFLVPIQIAQSAADVWLGKGKAAVTAEHVTFFLLMLLAAALGVLANLGFWLFGVGHGRRVAPEAEVDFGGSLADVLGLSQQRRLPPPPSYRRLAAEAATIVPPAADGGRGGSATANSAPINIFVGGERGGAEPVAADASPPPVQAAPPGERRELGAIASDAPPIDRLRVRRHMDAGEREAADVLLAFVTACLVDAPGAATPLLKLYERYVAWAGERALAAQAFAALLPDATGVAVSEIGGVLHARGVVVRLGARVAAVA